MRIRLTALSAGLRQHGICILHQDDRERFDLVENRPPDWPQGEFIGLRPADVLPPDIATTLTAAHSRIRATGMEQQVTFETGEGARRRFFEAHMLPDADGVTTVISDRTEGRGRDLALTSLLREVSHRSKNLLAIVQSVAMQTAHHSDNIQDFLDKFRGRLHALSSTQDLVTESDWRGTYLRPLVISQLERIGAPHLGHVRLSGINPLLGPNASLHIGLAIHELGANAILHGALAGGRGGNIDIDARLAERADRPAELVVEWRETGTDPEAIRHAPRFGTLVLERIVPLSVGGSADFRIAPDGVRYRLVVPPDQFDV